MQKRQIPIPPDPIFLESPSLEGIVDEGQRKAFEQTAVPHMSTLYTHALHLTMNSDDAKDLL